jgi:hypothetical protein
MFAAYDTCITDGERGVYNFSPVRKNGELTGYSYHDTVTNEYPFEKFPANDEIANIVKFVGINAEDVIASHYETKMFLESMAKNKDLTEFENKLYSVSDIFSPKTIKEQKN